MICFYCAETILNLLVLLRHFNRLIKTETVRKKTHTKKAGGGGGGGGEKKKKKKKGRKKEELLYIQYTHCHCLSFKKKKKKKCLCCLFGLGGGWVEVSDTCLLSFVIRCDATLFSNKKKNHVPPYNKHTLHAR